jgi:hypothetical protein
MLRKGLSFIKIHFKSVLGGVEVFRILYSYFQICPYSKSNINLREKSISLVTVEAVKLKSAVVGRQKGSLMGQLHAVSPLTARGKSSMIQFIVRILLSVFWRSERINGFGMKSSVEYSGIR